MNLEIFKYNQEGVQTELRVINKNGEVWFVGAQVCEILDIRNPRQAISRLDNDEKLPSLVMTSGQRRRVNLINESGLYSLIFSSRKKNAQKFRKWVTSEVLPSIRKNGSYSIDNKELPEFYKRYIDNINKVDKGYFSVISELIITLNAELEKKGYKMPDKGKDGSYLMPDISVGRLFANYLKETNSKYINSFKKYEHFISNRNTTVSARQYPEEAIPLFRQFVRDVWIPNNAINYFRNKDMNAIPFINQYLGIGTQQSFLN